MADCDITIAGNITREPELKFLPSGAPVANFSVAVNRRWFDKAKDSWEEQVSFFDVVAWRQLAENVAESLPKGARVIVKGRLEQRSWETAEGEKRSKVEVVADDIGASLSWATAELTKIERSGPTGNGSRREPAVTTASREAPAPLGEDESPW